MKLVHEKIDSNEYRYWRHSLADFPIEQLRQGLKSAEDWKGFLTLGDFRKLCQKPKTVPYHRPYDALPNKLGSERFQELMKVTNAMKKEGPRGPITRATNAGKLTNNFVQGKTAEEIIDYCKSLYA